MVLGELMKTKLLGAISLVSLALTALWLVLLVAGTISSGPMETFGQALANVNKLDWMFYLTYINAALITVSATMLFAGLYLYCKRTAPQWSMMGLVFVPIYSALNLFVYLSQITVVPSLLSFQRTAEYEAVSTLLLRLMVQQWPGSAVSTFNNLAYAILGVPSIIFGTILFKRSKSMRLPGVLLALNGVACIVGFVGVVLENNLMGLGSAAGGALYLLALIPLSVSLLRGEEGHPSQVE